MAQRPTIKDVAKRAKVSLKTVSRVINNEPAVQARTREKVQRAVAELDYRPDLSARSLRLALMGLACFELTNYVPAIFRERSMANPVVFQKLKQYQDIAEYLRKQPQPTRVNMEGEDFNFGDWEGIDMLTGFGAGVTATGASRRGALAGVAGDVGGARTTVCRSGAVCARKRGDAGEGRQRSRLKGSH